MSTEHRVSVSVCKMFWVDIAFAFSRRLKEQKWTLKQNFSVKPGNRLSTLRLFLLCPLS